MIKSKKILAFFLTALAFTSITVPNNLLTPSNTTAYASTYQKYPKGTLLSTTLQKTSKDLSTWYTEDNFPTTLRKRSGNNQYFTYHLTGVTYKKTSNGKAWITTAHYAID